MIENIKSSEFKDKIAEGVSIVKFGATWCAPCKIMDANLHLFSGTKPDQKIFILDVEEAAEIAKEFNIRSVPTTLLFKDGQLVKTKSGIISENQLNGFTNC